MKTTTRQPLAVGLVLLGLLSSSFVMAQDDLIMGTEDVLESDQIDIDGQFSNRESPSDRMAKMRKNLEKRNEQMVQKKIEDVRVKQEIQLTKQLQQAFTEGMNNMDQVSTGQAATQKVEAVAPVAPAPVVESKKSKVIPSFGVTQFNGEDVDGFESKINAGLSIESQVLDRLSVGVGVNYTTMEITDQSNSFGNQYYNTGFAYNTTGDQIDYSRLNINVNSKFFLTTDSRVLPYLGAGLGYNRTSLKYGQKSTNSSLYYNQAQDNSISASNVSAAGMVGAEINFSDTVGLAAEVRYSRSVTSGFERKLGTTTGTYESYNETVLRNIGSGLEDSEEIGLNVGLVVRF